MPGRKARCCPTDQFERLKRELEQTLSGRGNAGRPLLLEGGLDWKAMSLSPKDMDFLEAKHAAAREIALAFGVPPMLLGIPGDNTYANYQEANRVFWRADRAAAGVAASGRARAMAGAGVRRELRLVVDTDRIERWPPTARRCGSGSRDAPFLTLNEKREAVGYAPIEGGDRLE